MKTAEIFHRTHSPRVEHPPVRLLRESEVPPRRPIPDHDEPSQWPRNAMVTAAVLAVVALLLGITAIVGFATGDESTDAELEQTVAALTAERDDLTAEVSTLEGTMTEVVVERDDLQREVASQTDELETVLAERDQLLVAADAQAATIDDLDGTIAMLVDENRGLLVDVAQAEDDVDAQRAATIAALAERDALLDLFPIGVEAELDVDAVPGTYGVVVDEVYRVGFDRGTIVSQIDQLTIRETADGRLELVIDGYPVAGLAELDGVLYAVVDLTVVENDGTARIARTTVTIFADEASVADDGGQTITGLGASLTMAAPAAGTHPVGAAVFAMELTP